ncbi:MAG TPA: MtrB/PioB family outer membrane beta-barrel protein [Thermoanaerobaculia bacterium]
MRTLRNKLSKPFVLMAGLLLLTWAGSLAAQETTQPQDNAQQTQTMEKEMAPAASDAKTEPARGFTFRVDPLVLGVVRTHVDTNSAKWEEYRDMSNGFVIPYLRLIGEGSGDRELDFNAVNVRREDARYNLFYGVPGSYELTLDYNKIPHHFGNDGHMLYTRTGPGRLEIADPIQAALQGAIAAQFATNPGGITYAFLNRLLSPYLATAQAINLGLERNRFLAQLDLGRMGPFAWGLEYDHEKRTGNRAYGASFGFSNATEVPEPIDYDTTGAQIAGEWNGANGGLGFGYRYSKFENNISTLIWDNPFRVTGATDPSAYTAPGAGSIGGSNVGLADLNPSNRADLLFLNGRTRFGSWFASGSAAYDMMKQDDALLPYTLNSSIVGIGFNGGTFDPTNPANLPVRSADRKINTTALNGDLGTRFGQSLDLTFRYRYYDLANKGKRVEFPGYVRYDAVWENIARVSVPYAYTKQNASAELGWDLARATRLGLSFERESWNRKFREIKDSDENIWKATFDTRPTSWFALRSSYQYGDRSIGNYSVAAGAEASFVEPEDPTNLPALRKYDEAPRKEHLYNVQAQLFPSESWTFFLGGVGDNQKFDESVFGLGKDDTNTYNAELSYAPGDNFNFFVFGSRQDRKVNQAARQSGATPSTNPLDSWFANLDETTDTWGAGLTSQFAKRWTLDLSANYSKSDGKAGLFSPPGGAPDVAVGFSNYDNVKLFSILGRVDYKINKSAKAGLFGRWEDYKIDSFILQGLTNYLPGALLLDPNYGDYRGSLVGVDLSFTF